MSGFKCPQNWPFLTRGPFDTLPRGTFSEVIHLACSFANFTFSFVSSERFSTQKRICSYIRKCTCERQNRTSVRNAPNRSPIPPTCRSTRGFTWASSRTDAKSVSANSHSCLICSSTFGRTRATSRTNVATRTVRKPSRSSPTFNLIPDPTRPTNRTNVIVATSASLTKPAFSTIFQNTKNRSISRRTFANFVASRTRRKLIWVSLSPKVCASFFI